MSTGDKPPARPILSRTDDWRELAAKASKESDPNKLLELINEMCDSIDRERAQGHVPVIGPKKTGPGPDRSQQTNG